jgi:hypothetical protein
LLTIVTTEGMVGLKSKPVDCIRHTFGDSDLKTRFLQLPAATLLAAANRKTATQQNQIKYVSRRLDESQRGFPGPGMSGQAARGGLENAQSKYPGIGGDGSFSDWKDLYFDWGLPIRIQNSYPPNLTQMP